MDGFFCHIYICPIFKYCLLLHGKHWLVQNRDSPSRRPYQQGSCTFVFIVVFLMLRKTVVSVFLALYLKVIQIGHLYRYFKLNRITLKDRCILNATV